MTQHNTTSIVIGGEDLGDRLVKERSTILSHILQGILGGVELYQHLPAAVVQDDIRDVIAENVRLMASAMHTGAIPTADQAGRLVASAHLRAEEGIPVEAVMDAYLIGVQESWRALTAEAGVEDVEALREICDRILSYLRVVIPAVVGAYVENAGAAGAGDEASTEAYLRALVAGAPFDAESARRAGLDPAGEYALLVLSLPGPVDAAPDTVAERVTALRRARAVRVAVRRHAGQAFHVERDARTAMLVIPWPGEEDDVTRGEELRRHLIVETGEDLTVVVVRAEPGRFAAAVEQVWAMQSVVRSSPRPAGTYRMRDLALEVHLAHRSPASSALVGLLQPLDAHPELHETLTHFLASGLRRREAATRLRVHPNTVDYRLNRIADLTGRRANDPSDLPLLLAAVTASRGGTASVSG